jgi:endogenous inhibitor of DNA gyrase (YacG/DUF329 family)
MASRLCEQCGKEHTRVTSPLCVQCREQNSKRNCPIDGCTERIGAHAHTCLMHRHLRQTLAVTQCRECGTPFERPLLRGVCEPCREQTRILCACGCGRYRRKYGPDGQVYEYVSGHNDNYRDSRRPQVPCAVCARMFKAASSRTKLCSTACRTVWLTINPPNERKRTPIPCAACGTIVYRAPSQLKQKGRLPACSKRCRYIIVANKLSGVRSSPTRLAMQRDGATCRLCGFDVVVHVHHIVHKARGGNNSLGNLITLCPNHHAMAHRGLVATEELYAALHAPVPVPAVAD